MRTVQEALKLPLSTAVKEVDKSWPFVVKLSDHRHAVPRDPCKCVVAKAVRRTLGGAAIVMSELAYVEMRDPKGRTYIGKFSIPKPVREAIKTFDDTGAFPVDVAMELTPVYPSKRSDIRRFQAKLRRQAAREAKAKAEAAGLKLELLPPAPKSKQTQTPRRPRLFDTSLAARTAP